MITIDLAIGILTLLILLELLVRQVINVIKFWPGGNGSNVTRLLVMLSTLCSTTFTTLFIFGHHYLIVFTFAVIIFRAIYEEK